MLAQIDQAMTDTGPRTAATRERFCVVSRAVRPLDELIRFVASPDGVVTPDLKRKLPGRGAWVTARRDVVAQAVRRGALKRALGADVAVPADLPELTERLLHRAVLDALAIAGKAGQAVSGFTKTLDAVTAGSASGLLHAREAAADGVRKIVGAAGLGGQGRAALPVIKIFASAELDLALTRSNVVHAALLSGYASEAVLARWRVLDRYCTTASGEKDGDKAAIIKPGPGS